jgi:hypothetical protein
VQRLAFILGVVLLLGGAAHSTGVLHMYIVRGWPDLNRILLDVWIAEAQVAGGCFFLVASRALRIRAILTGSERRRCRGRIRGR